MCVMDSLALRMVRLHRPWHMYCVTCEVTCYTAAPVWHQFELSVVSCPLSMVHLWSHLLRSSTGLTSIWTVCRILPPVPGTLVKSLATQQHWFDINLNCLSYPAPCPWYTCEVTCYAAAPVWHQLELSVVSCPLSLVQFHPKCNQSICLW